MNCQAGMSFLAQRVYPLMHFAHAVIRDNQDKSFGCGNIYNKQACQHHAGPVTFLQNSYK